MLDVIPSLRGRLIVSCQAYPGEPMRDADTMRRIAEASVLGGAAGIRAQGLDDLRAIHQAVNVPLIGLWKDGAAPVFITPTVRHAVAVAQTGCEIVAIDGTRRERPDGSTLADSIAAVHQLGVLVMADCATYDDGVAATAAGADLIGTTLSGYTEDTEKTIGPDLVLVAALAADLDVPVVCEGRVHTPAQAAAAIDAGAYAVVVGTAITHPTTISGWFADAIRSADNE